ncbi:MAG TPA: short chain dehydrogenase [Rhodobacteraceae bacterium]|jgi:NAD(P)-dependent dehydrogenase (short-subunit alcohol dehydrogenase family)|nr:SDR family oxidoreductase [Paracoccaceae bacterium]HBG97290.1 short chain dehydrogenase [Paracoccaceae bacterium]
MVERALITGAARRLGRAMAAALARDGVAVAVHYAGSAAAAAELVDEIVAAGGRAHALQADLLTPEGRATLVPRAAEALGGALDLLVNNASIFEHDSIQTATPESWDRHIDSNLRAPFELTQAFAAQAPGPALDGQGEPLARAHVINMIDQRVRKPVPDFITYGIAKAGLWAFTRMAAQALGPQGIRVNAIGPGPTLQGDRQTTAGFAAQRVATILRRGGDPADIVAAMRFILSAGSMTGQLICIDGGQHLGWETPDVQGVE